MTRVCASADVVPFIKGHHSTPGRRVWGNRIEEIVLMNRGRRKILDPWDLYTPDMGKHGKSGSLWE